MISLQSPSEIERDRQSLCRKESSCTEYHRITNTNLRNQFYAKLDRHIPHLFVLYRQKASCAGKILKGLHDISKIYDLQYVHDVNIKRTLALRALAVYLREDDPQFFKTWNVEESGEPDISDTAVGLVMMVTENTTGPICFNAASTGIVVEDDFVMSDIRSYSNAFVLLFGLISVLHLDYPKKLIYAFTFIQKILMGLDDGKPLKPCLLNLKNDLLLKE